MKYDYYEDPESTKVSAKGIGEGIGDVLGQALQGLASWIGLDGLLKEWNSNTHKKTKDKIRELRSKIQQLINAGDINLDSLEKEIDRLNLGGYGLTGRAAQIAGEYKKSLENKRKRLISKNKEDSIQYDKMLQDLDKADQGASDLSASGARTSKEIADNVEKVIGGK